MHSVFYVFWHAVSCQIIRDIFSWKSKPFFPNWSHKISKTRSLLNTLSDNAHISLSPFLCLLTLSHSPTPSHPALVLSLSLICPVISVIFLTHQKMLCYSMFNLCSFACEVTSMKRSRLIFSIFSFSEQGESVRLIISEHEAIIQPAWTLSWCSFLMKKSFKGIHCLSNLLLSYGVICVLFCHQSKS